jgi:hypothetical protein
MIIFLFIFRSLCTFYTSVVPQRSAYGTVPFQAMTYLLKNSQSLPWAGEGLDSSPGLLQSARCAIIEPSSPSDLDHAGQRKGIYC